MSTLAFARGNEQLTLRASDGSVLGTWDAANFVDSRSKGIWPNGQYNFAYYVDHPDDPPESAYGSHGILIFEVPGREGMGVHSGRQGVPDGFGRSGFEHCTMGCVRTTDDAMAQLIRTHQMDPIASIVIAG